MVINRCNIKLIHRHGKRNQDKDWSLKVVESLNKKNIIELNEGEEPDEFWELLGGKTPYLSE